MPKVIIAGSGNAALSAGIAALECGAEVLILEKADPALAGGNTKYTAGAMRFAYASGDDLLPLLRNPADPRLSDTDFGSYTEKKFSSDLLSFNDGRPLSPEQHALISESYDTVRWLASHDVKFEPIYSRQSFMKDGRHVFWGGLTLAAENEGVGLFDQELAAFHRMGGEIRYGTPVADLTSENGRVTGVTTGDGHAFAADAVILACGGFEANAELRQEHIGPAWDKAKVRGTPHNTGDGLLMARALGAQEYGFYGGCHATPMDLHMADYGNLDLPHRERKYYRKICYFLGVMLNAKGERFVDEGINFRNYTYAQFGAAIMEQPGHFAWQIFDAKVFDLLYGEYSFHDAHYVESATLEGLVAKLDGVDQAAALKTLENYNAAVDQGTAFDPTSLDGKAAAGVSPRKSNWAQTIEQGPFRAYPVTGGITFTYGGLKVDAFGAVLSGSDTPIDGLYACGELVGGVFFNGYPGGSGLTSGAVFGRRAGRAAGSPSP
ncbi:Fumarate reductase flavoprotein subunit [Candidatus Rhodobacter oscarellae]|uniref:Fumarate reductase flavoprotein subunit n=1 Tax=Candidatus Rhodobacter oscarellae TaxID=1675527 RepID=A0A0J9H0U7_9RHOB|nr:FAD-dependent tricarballylate dehydrogenase TcuA [Candidatus Rhodobacter lobularis]KMW59368.1 Fumarate reductase flavoprotein subunit [Candidatus Rhodobacter lobularis]